MNRLQRAIAGVGIFSAAVASSYMGMGLVQNVQFANAQQQVESSREQLAQVEDLATVFREVGKVVEPSVVQVKVIKSTARGGGARNLPFDEDLLRRLFPDRDGDGEPDMPPEMEDGPQQQGTGSGVIMEVDGNTAYVVTNNHVAGGATEMVLTLSDGRRVENATLVGADPKTDLAVLKIEAERLIPAKWGDSDKLQKGDWIIAFGSPFGYVGSMTHGIVSALNRTGVGILGTMGYENFIQVDAPINPGNSGGPLVNVRGEVVGINTAIASVTGGFQGVGFAIPANQAQQVYKALRENGKIVRGYLGVEIDDVANPRSPQTELALENTGFTGKKGVFVGGTQANAPAAGKLEPGDVVTQLNGKDVQSVQQLRNEVATMKPGDEVKLNVFRDGKTQEVTVKLGEQPDEIAGRRGGRGPLKPDAATGIAAVGVRLSDVNDELAQKFGVGDAREGALVTQVAPGSPAERAGLQAGDLITRVGKTAVKDVKGATDALAKADLNKGVTIHVTNREGSRLLTIQQSKQ